MHVIESINPPPLNIPKFLLGNQSNYELIENYDKIKNKFNQDVQ